MTRKQRRLVLIGGSLGVLALAAVLVLHAALEAPFAHALVVIGFELGIRIGRDRREADVGLRALDAML